MHRLQLFRDINWVIFFANDYCRLAEVYRLLNVSCAHRCIRWLHRVFLVCLLSSVWAHQRVDRIDRRVSFLLLWAVLNPEVVTETEVVLGLFDLLHNVWLHRQVLDSDRLISSVGDHASLVLCERFEFELQTIN
jgi:hypothetical protein